MTVFAHRITRNHYHGKVRCLAGGRKSCLSRPEFVLHFEYTKHVTSQLTGVRREVVIVCNRPACEKHAEKFARQHAIDLTTVRER